MSTTKDSTVMEFGGIVVKEVTETRDSVGGTIKKIENIETRNSELMKPVLSMYFFFIITLLVILAISFWYYVKSKTDIAKLMIQNNMQPNELFKFGSGEKSNVSRTLKLAIFFIALGIAFLINFFLQSAGLQELQIVVFMLSIGVSLLVINKLKK